MICFVLGQHLKRSLIWDTFILKIPIFGNIIKKSILARVSLVMGNLTQAGVDILESLDIAKSVSTNVLVKEAIENIKKGVFSGESLTKLFKKETSGGAKIQIIMQRHTNHEQYICKKDKR